MSITFLDWRILQQVYHLLLQLQTFLTPQRLRRRLLLSYHWLRGVMTG
jgi:hypothetical protein